MTPNIIDIVKVSLKIAKYIIFFFPRTLVIEDLIDILYSCIMENNSKGELYNNDLMSNNILEKMFLDIHILKSANKIKALMIIFGHDCDSSITTSDLKEYLELNYPDAKPEKTQTLCNIAKIVGNFKLLKAESQLRKTYSQDTNVSKTFYDALIKYLTTQVLTDIQLVKFKKVENKNNVCTNFLHTLGTNINTGNTNIIFKDKITKPIETNIIQKSMINENKITSGITFNLNKNSKGNINLINSNLNLKKKK